MMLGLKARGPEWISTATSSTKIFRKRIVLSEQQGQGHERERGREEERERELEREGEGEGEGEEGRGGGAGSAAGREFALRARPFLATCMWYNEKT